MKEIPTERSAFPPTRWTVVLTAAGGGSDEAHTALSELCRLYWYPLYAFARRQGLSPGDAEDRTQDFFAVLLANNLLARADRNAGKLRTFLLVAFSRDLSDARKSASRQKRGGGAAMLPLEAAEAESRFLNASDEAGTPEQVFDREWAVSVLDGAMARVEANYQSNNRGALFTALRPWITPGAGAGDSAAVADALALSPESLRTAIHRLRERFRDALRAHIADTLASPTDAAVEEEMTALRAVLSK